MTPLICFYRDGLYLHSRHYEIISCTANESVRDFLIRIEKKYAQKMKILQINFEFENQNLFAHQKKLYESAKAAVFILENYEILPLQNKHAVCDIAFKVLIEKQEFIRKVEYIKNEIARGRLYQVNLTAPLAGTSSAPPEEIFYAFQSSFASEYKALLPFANHDIVSLSPELFLERQNGRLRTRPIKGSLPENQRSENQLLTSKKEEAELSMIVDLLRNDLNKIDARHSAQVSKHREILHLGYIQHTFSEIEIQTEASLARVLDCCLPGGSISGCPKIESLNLIAELETYQRQAYTGALGWWQGDDFCLNLSIRSFIKSGENIFYHSGCGIVYDSVAENEWHEFLLKTGKLLHTTEN